MTTPDTAQLHDTQRAASASLVSATSQPATTQPASAQPAKPTPALRLAQALARLQASRDAMRLELLPPEPTGREGTPNDPGWQRLWRPLRRWARRSAAASALVRAVQQTWHVHPLRPVAQALVDGYRAQVAPLVRKHPWGAVAVAAGLGAALVASRQWHGPLLTRSLQPLPARLGRWAVSQLSSAPVQTVLAGWLLMAATARPGDEATADSAADTAADRAADPAADTTDESTARASAAAATGVAAAAAS